MWEGLSNGEKTKIDFSPWDTVFFPDDVTMDIVKTHFDNLSIRCKGDDPYDNFLGIDWEAWAPPEEWIKDQIVKTRQLIHDKGIYLAALNDLLENPIHQEPLQVPSDEEED